MNRLQRMLSALIVGCGLAVVGGCTVYQTAPGVYVPTPPNTFDRSWSSAVGALADEGVQIVNEDRGAGYVRGMRGGITVTALVRTQADGSVRVEFKTSGNTDADPSLNDRITNSYNRRMGR